MNRCESNVLNTAAQAVAYARRAGLPNVLVRLDTYRMNIEEADLEAALIETGERLGLACARMLGEAGAKVVLLDRNAQAAEREAACIANSVGMAIRKPSLELDDWNRVINVNLTGTFLCARAAARHMSTTGSLAR